MNRMASLLIVGLDSSVKPLSDSVTFSEWPASSKKRDNFIFALSKLTRVKEKGTGCFFWSYAGWGGVGG
jgi:hypothetical protein